MNLSRPRPVLTAAGISGLVTSLAGVLTWLGYVGPGMKLSTLADAIGAVVVGAVVMGSHLLAGLHAQGKVTPVDNPQAADGTPLVRQAPIPVAVATVTSEPVAVEPMAEPAEPAPAPVPPASQ